MPYAPKISNVKNKFPVRIDVPSSDCTLCTLVQVIKRVAQQPANIAKRIIFLIILFIVCNLPIFSYFTLLFISDRLSLCSSSPHPPFCRIYLVFTAKYYKANRSNLFLPTALQRFRFLQSFRYAKPIFRHIGA